MVGMLLHRHEVSNCLMYPTSHGCDRQMLFILWGSSCLLGKLQHDHVHRDSLKIFKIKENDIQVIYFHFWLWEECVIAIFQSDVSAFPFKNVFFFLGSPWYFKNRLFKMCFCMCTFMHLEACNTYSLITAPSPLSASLASMLLRKITWGVWDIA